MIVIGIDPGKKGGIAVLTHSEGQAPQIKKYYAMPLHDDKKTINAVVVHDILKYWTPDVIVLERVHAMPGQGVVSMFSFGCSYCSIRAIVELIAMDMSVQVLNPTPQMWKKVALEGTNKDKGAALVKAYELWPDVSFTLEGHRVKHEGCVEAALMAYYGWQKNK